MDGERGIRRKLCARKLGWNLKGLDEYTGGHVGRQDKNQQPGMEIAARFGWMVWPILLGYPLPVSALEKSKYAPKNKGYVWYHFGVK